MALTPPTLTVEQAQDRILSGIHSLDVERVVVAEAFGRVAGEDILATRNQPPTANSAMDGYAATWPDLSALSEGWARGDEPGGVRLRVIETIAAGGMPTKPLGPGEATRIMTGAPVPEGADIVVMREWTDEGGETVRINRCGARGDNIRPAGEDVALGDAVAVRGSTLNPGRLGLLVGQGLASVPVFRRPIVGILPTGDEIHEPGEPLPPGHIYSSNSYALAAMVREAGGIPRPLGIARDTRESLRAAFAAAEGCDVLLTIGGVSVGDFDYVKDVLAELGAEEDFWRVAMRPGKPNAHGRLGDMPYFGLPGNPVSCMVSFLQYVRPALLAMQGRTDRFLPTVDAVLDHDLRSRRRFLFFFRGVVRWSHDDARWTVRTTGPQGSGILRSMAEANCLIVVPEDRGSVTAGETVRVQMLPNSSGRIDAGLR
jgi:molybdopterin molybdotransferase